MATTHRVGGLTAEVFLIPIFADNYVFAGRILGGRSFFAVDPGEPTALLAFLKEQGATLDHVLLTHEHSDHIGGVPQVLKHFPDCKIVGPPSARAFLPDLNDKFHDPQTDQFQSAGVEFQIKHWPGHTTDHFSYHIERENFLFCGDTLFGLGCGRIISGTYEQLFASLQAIKRLTEATQIFCSHEYGMRNLVFLKQKSPSFPSSFLAREKITAETIHSLETNLNTRLEREAATVPLHLEFERKFNPFLRAESFAEFEAIRKLRNAF